MAFTVRTLLELPSARTRSLTPGIGEDRPIAWAHVCELAEPWKWLGSGALVMTTGLAVPESAADQSRYFEGMQAVGIAAVTIGEDMSAPPLTAEALAHASELGFPVLETAHETPFIGLAMAVAEAAQQERAMRVQRTERLYAALGAHASDGIEPLLEDLGAVLGGTAAVRPSRRARGATHGRVEQLGARVFEVPLLAPGDPALRLTLDEHGSLDLALLQHASAIVSSALSVAAAARRHEWMYGSILLANLADGTVPPAPAERLVAAHGVGAPYAVASWPVDDPREAVEAALAGFSAAELPALATIKDGHVLLLAQDGEGLVAALESLVPSAGAIGVSAPFPALDGFASGIREANLALVHAGRNGAASVTRFEPASSGSLFLPESPSQLRALAAQVLDPLFAYDRRRGTQLLPTLRVFLEENRGWVRAADRLFIHRQTLIARVARIEQVLERDLSTLADATECWLALQAAIECGLVEPIATEDHTNVRGIGR